MPETMEDQRAGKVPLIVVAAKKPGHWIVRAMGSWHTAQELRAAVERFTGSLDPELEWTTHTYEGLPGYVVYGKGDLPPVPLPRGVYRFDHQSGNIYRSEPVRLGDI